MCTSCTHRICHFICTRCVPQAQGCTLKRVILDITPNTKAKLSLAALYVALTRVKSGNHVRLFPNNNDSHIKLLSNYNQDRDLVAWSAAFHVGDITGGGGYFDPCKHTAWHRAAQDAATANVSAQLAGRTDASARPVSGALTALAVTAPGGAGTRGRGGTTGRGRGFPSAAAVRGRGVASTVLAVTAPGGTSTRGRGGTTGRGRGVASVAAGPTTSCAGTTTTPGAQVRGGAGRGHVVGAVRLGGGARGGGSGGGGSGTAFAGGGGGAGSAASPSIDIGLPGFDPPWATPPPLPQVHSRALRQLNPRSRFVTAMSDFYMPVIAAALDAAFCPQLAQRAQLAFGAEYFAWLCHSYRRDFERRGVRTALTIANLLNNNTLAYLTDYQQEALLVPGSKLQDVRWVPDVPGRPITHAPAGWLHSTLGIPGSALPLFVFGTLFTWCNTIWAPSPPWFTTSWLDASTFDIAHRVGWPQVHNLVSP